MSANNNWVSAIFYGVLYTIGGYWLMEPAVLIGGNSFLGRFLIYFAYLLILSTLFIVLDAAIIGAAVVTAYAISAFTIPFVLSGLLQSFTMRYQLAKIVPGDYTSKTRKVLFYGASILLVSTLVSSLVFTAIVAPYIPLIIVGVFGLFVPIKMLYNKICGKNLTHNINIFDIFTNLFFNYILLNSDGRKNGLTADILADDSSKFAHTIGKKIVEQSLEGNLGRVDDIYSISITNLPKKTYIEAFKNFFTKKLPNGNTAYQEHLRLRSMAITQGVAPLTFEESDMRIFCSDDGKNAAFGSGQFSEILENYIQETVSAHNKQTNQRKEEVANLLNAAHRMTFNSSNVKGSQPNV